LSCLCISLNQRNSFKPPSFEIERVLKIPRKDSATLIFSSLLDNLIPALPLNSPHQEALSSFLLLPECCAALEAQKMQHLAIPFAKAVKGLSKRSLDILEKCWSFLPASHLDRIVQMLKKVVLSQLPCYSYYPACQVLLPLLEVLKKLYKVASLKHLLNMCRFPQIVKANACDTLVRNRLLRKDELPKLPVFPLRVRRKNLVEDTLRKLSQVEDISLKMQLLVSCLRPFEGEMPGHETGGVLFEFFSYVFEEMVQPDYGMFMCCEQNSPIWFPSRVSISGRGPGPNKHLVTAYVPFPLAAFKKLLGKKPTLDDLKELSPVLGRLSLLTLGYSIHLNLQRPKEFVNKYVDYVFNKSVEGIFQEFKRGFYKVLDERMVAFFEPQELMDVAIGNANYDWELYEKNTVYWGIYSETHPTVRMFWKVFHELTLADKKGFLLFVLGSDRVPVVGMDSLKLTIHSHKSLSEEHIPEAQICFHLLLLPPYSTTGKLKEKLLQAIENNRGFGKQL
uniref:HECT-type E3 ubiquitin transferase n=1 Tax=Podarcis muralis TaxID=64176 RepID=A0A670K4V6_PODMU